MLSTFKLGMAVAAATAVLLAPPTLALDKMLDGVNYDLRQGPDWDADKCKNAATIASELKALSAITSNVRTYALADCDVSPVITTAKSLEMTVWLGVWVSADETVFKNELKVAQSLFDDGLIDDNIIGFNVGSEAVYREDITAEEAVSYLSQFKKFLKKNKLSTPVAITDIIDVMLAHPEMVEAGDVVTINQFPFWEKVPADKAVAQFNKRLQPLLELAGDKPVIITETGWPSAGINVNASAATPASSTRYLNDFYELATKENWKYYYFQAFDSPWKTEIEGEEDTVEGSFGLFDASGVLKPSIEALTIGDKSTVPDVSDDSAGSGTSTATDGANTATDGTSTATDGTNTATDGTNTDSDALAPAGSSEDGSNNATSLAQSALASVFVLLSAVLVSM